MVRKRKARVESAVGKPPILRQRKSPLLCTHRPILTRSPLTRLRCRITLLFARSKLSCRANLCARRIPAFPFFQYTVSRPYCEHFICAPLSNRFLVPWNVRTKQACVHIFNKSFFLSLFYTSIAGRRDKSSAFLCTRRQSTFHVQCSDALIFTEARCTVIAVVIQYTRRMGTVHCQCVSLTVPEAMISQDSSLHQSAFVVRFSRPFQAFPKENA